MLAALSQQLSLVTPAPGRVAPMQRSADVSMAAKDSVTAGQVAGMAAAVLAVGVQSASAGPFTRTDIASLTYQQIKGTGLANTCPVVEQVDGMKTEIKVGGNYKIDEFCLEPTSFQARPPAQPSHDARRASTPDGAASPRRRTARCTRRWPLSPRPPPLLSAPAPPPDSAAAADGCRFWRRS